MVIAAAKAKKAIFCEKPLTLDLDEGEAMEAAIAKNRVFFQLGFMRRFDKAYAAAKKKIEAGVIGTPIVFKSTSKDPFPPPVEFLRPASSGGIFMDMGIHDFDLARWFMGEVKSVFSAGGALAYPEVGEGWRLRQRLHAAELRERQHRHGALSRTGIYGYGIDTEIVGTEGTLQIGYDRETAVLVMTKGVIAHDSMPGFYERFEQAYVCAAAEFRRQCAPRPSGADRLQGRDRRAPDRPRRHPLVAVGQGRTGALKMERPSISSPSATSTTRCSTIAAACRVLPAARCIILRLPPNGRAPGSVW